MLEPNRTANNISLPIIRSIPKCVEMIKNIDKDSDISAWYIRNLCNENKVKHHMSGGKILVNFNDLIKYISEN